MTPLVLVVLAALVAGALVACQPAINFQLAQRLGQPSYAALVSFASGVACLLLVNVLVWRLQGPPDWEGAGEAPWYLWLAGGAIGATFVTLSIWGVPRLGAAGWFTTVIAAQLGCAVLLDHFGALGLRERPASALRILGVVLMGAGAALVTLTRGD